MPRFNSPAEAQSNFYRAIESGDAAAMMQTWSTEHPLVCIHPGAPRLDERELIAESWHQILSPDAKLSFRLSEENCVEHPGLAIYTARVEVSLDDEWVDSLLTTNVYVESAGGWHMIVHHASPDPAFDEVEIFDERVDLDEEQRVVLH